MARKTVVNKKASAPVEQPAVVPAQPSTSAAKRATKKNEAALLAIVNPKYVIPDGSTKRAAAAKAVDYKISKVQSKKSKKNASKTVKKTKKAKKD